MNQEFVPGSKPNGAAIFIQPEAQRSGSHQFADLLIHEIDGLGMREKLAGDFFSLHSGDIDDFDVRNFWFLSPDTPGNCPPITQPAEVEF
ncbi:MAG: hypothetical protein IAE94_05455 [Chthoniobacterales bacterium]|nr:hypothetical protein [Chthoniobacterales bacterium]